MIRLFIPVAAFVVAGAAFAHEFPGEVDRFRDGDTFEGEIYFPRFAGDFRLYCIDTPESFGADQSDAGKQISEVVKGLRIKRGHYEIVKPGTFRDYLVWFRPEGWKITLNEWLWKRGVPLYDGLTRRERRICLDRLGEQP
jgi:hypothetical protein